MTRRVDPTLFHGDISARIPLAEATVYSGGTVIKRVIPGKAPSSTSHRGIVDGFSPQSRRRLMELLMQVDFAQQPVCFITLTYPGEYVHNRLRWKQDLHAFHKWLARSPDFEFVWAIWRLEPQKRGAPHYHLVVGFADKPSIPLLRDQARLAWSRILNLLAVEGSFARVDVQPAYLELQRGQQRLLNYLAKYVGKRRAKRSFANPQTGELEPSGRVWGKWGDLKLADSIRVAMLPAHYVEFCRRVRKVYRSDRFLSQANVGWTSFLAYIPGHVMRQLLRGLAAH